MPGFEPPKGLLGVNSPGEDGGVGDAGGVLAEGTSTIVPQSGQRAFLPALSSGVRSSLVQPVQRNSIGIAATPREVRSRKMSDEDTLG